MARLNTRAVSSDVESVSQSTSSRLRQQPSSHTPPSEPFDSDKENRRTKTPSRGEKRKSTTTTMSAASGPETISSNKRRRLSEKGQTQSTQTARQKELSQRVNKDYYDPNQDPEERRKTKKTLRALHSKLQDSRTEYLRPNSTGLVDTLRKADQLYKNVKQTSDATVDSRLLVAAADLSYLKIKNMTLGDSSVGIDVDDFITKCIAFMKKGDDVVEAQGQPTSTVLSSTQTQRRRRQEFGDDEEVDNGDAMNWDYLGRNACFLYNSRPCLSGFLLGPLSVQKKVRQQTQRRAREARTVPGEAVRPRELGDDDREKQESASLTVVCAEIAALLQRTQTRGTARVEQEFEEADDDISEQEIKSLMRKHGVASNGCVPLFDFCVNPKSFGQTVENMFYISFLIKEGKVGLDFDSDGLPTLASAQPKSLAERQETQRNQAVFTLDFDVWEDIVKSYGIQKSIIPHRKDEVYDDGTISRVDESVQQEEDEEVSDAYA